MRESVAAGLNKYKHLKHAWALIKFTKTNMKICKYLYNNGIFGSYLYNPEGRYIKIYYSIYNTHKSLTYIKKLSNFGRRRYIGYHKLCKLAIFDNTYLLSSTSKGISDNKEAMAKKLGGELLYIIQC